MLKININNQHIREVEFEDDSLTSGKINGKDFSVDIKQVSNSTYHVLKDNKSYFIEIVSFNKQEKIASILINGNNYDVEVKDKYDQLLKTLGFSFSENSVVKDLKAPMPGLILDVKVKKGDEIKENDPLVVLEAMKMENILKSPIDGKIKTIEIAKGDTVEKNKIMITFE